MSGYDSQGADEAKQVLSWSGEKTTIKRGRRETHGQQKKVLVRSSQKNLSNPEAGGSPLPPSSRPNPTAAYKESAL